MAGASRSTRALNLVAQLPTFRNAYSKRRCIVPVDCFFEATLREIEDGEWRAFQPADAALRMEGGAALETTIQGN